MHILADHYRSEFLATPQLFRIDFAQDQGGPVPTLLLKGSTLLLKYIVQGTRTRLILARVKDRLLYGITVLDDMNKPATLWSILEHEAERKALTALLTKDTCPFFLFNELALNVAWTTVRLSVPPEVNKLISSSAWGPVDHRTLKDDVANLIDRVSTESATSEDIVTIELSPTHEWRAVYNHYITNRGINSPVHLFSQDEGGQQEQLAIWLTDSLQVTGVHHSPQISKGSVYRELTDLLLTHQYGTILLESKTLTIFNRKALPTRDELADDVTRHISKAVNQLRGAIRKLKQGVVVTSKSGGEIAVERKQPVHAIVLLPDFDLIEDPSIYGKQFIADFVGTTGGFIHLLDIAELLRVVQAAEMISKRGVSTSPMMAFDYYLIERAKKALANGTLCIEVLLRFED